jgi:hypothetical protein
LGNAFAALAAIFQKRGADLAWPERSKGTKVPAYEKAASSFSPVDCRPLTADFFLKNRRREAASPYRGEEPRLKIQEAR